MQDPEFAEAYVEMQSEMNVIRAMIDARISQNMSQKEMSERTGIARTEISKLENGTRNSSIKLLKCHAYLGYKCFCLRTMSFHADLNLTKPTR